MNTELIARLKNCGMPGSLEMQAADALEAAQAEIAKKATDNIKIVDVIAKQRDAALARLAEIDRRNQLNQSARSTVDNLLAQAGYAEDSSARNLLGCMNFDAAAGAFPEQPTGDAERQERDTATAKALFANNRLHGEISALNAALGHLWPCAFSHGFQAAKQVYAAGASPESTSGDYALGYAEGFNDACKPKAQPSQAVELSESKLLEWILRNGSQELVGVATYRTSHMGAPETVRLTHAAMLIAIAAINVKGSAS